MSDSAGPPQIVKLKNAVVHPDGRITPADGALAVKNATAFPLLAGDGVSFSDFLIGKLATALTVDGQAAPLILCGPALTTRQAELLDSLGRLPDYMALRAPAGFREVAGIADMQAPSFSLRVFSKLLRRVPPSAPKRLAILPQRGAERFTLTNRASLMAWLAARQFITIAPDSLAIKELRKSLAAVSLLVLADPAHAGLLCFCAPGARILEIAPDGWMNGTVRQLCGRLGLSWTALHGSAPTYPLSRRLDYGTHVPLSYEVPIRGLARILDDFTES